MKRYKQNLEYTEKRRGRSLDATGAGPYVRLGIVLLALVVTALAVIFLIVPLIRGTIDWDATLIRRTPAPVTAAEETPAVPAIISSRVQTLKLDARNGEAVLADAAISDGELVYASGLTETACDRIVRLDLSSGKSRTVVPVLKNDCLRNPRANADYLVWFDAKDGGGGNICLRRAAGGEDIVLVQLEAGLPALHLDGQYLLFTAKSGRAVKLYIIDLASFEALTLALLEGELAASAPDIEDGRVFFACEGGIRSADLRDGTAATIETDVFVHDPQALGDGLLWLSGNHGEDTDLYYRAADGKALIIARGIIDARAAADCAVYSRDGTVYVYSLPEDRFYMLSGAEEYAQLIDAQGDHVLWRVLSADEVYYRYMKVN